MLDSIVSPLSARVATSSALGNNVPVTIRVRNLDDVAVNNFTIRYSINAGPFNEETVNVNIAARATYTHSFPGIDLSTAGTYQITAVVINNAATDPNKQNDTLRSPIIHLPNDPLVLTQPFKEDFESSAESSLQRNTLGIAGLSHWDYANTNALARLRTFVTSDIYDNGQRAITLDVSRALPPGDPPFNALIGTFNLSNYNVTDHEIRLTFRFKHHGFTQQAGPLNKVWARGSDNLAWVEIFDIGVNQAPLGGIWQTIAGIDIAGKLKTAGQQFSSSTQLRFGQLAGYSMADNENFAGYTFDDISLLIGQNDLELTDILSPAYQNCMGGGNVPLTIKVSNGMPVGFTNIPVRYRLNGGAWIQETIPSIAARESVNYTFSSLVAWPADGKISIEAEVLNPGDNIPENNLEKLDILLQPVISTFPYYQDFENGSAGFVADGIHNTWEFGKPSSLRINTAASGQNAWKTRLTGDYKNLEDSYLYTPCFNISGLSFPMLGFHMAYSFEDCRNFNFVCDAGWMEYSFDGNTWQKLGNFGDGQNWYDYEPQHVWMRSNQTEWREVIIPLPVHNGTIRLRYVMSSDEGSTREGMAIDNFHVYNGGPLPLNWMWFIATQSNDGHAALKWKVFNRSEGDRFLVQVSRQEGLNASWENIGNLLAMRGDGGQYAFTDDRTKKSGLLFYRIQWIKANGESSYSPVRSLLFDNMEGAILLYPNPADSWLQVQAGMQDNTICSIKIFSTDGKLVYSTRQAPLEGIVSARINLAPLKLVAGVYFIEVSNENQRKASKWVKP